MHRVGILTLALLVVAVHGSSLELLLREIEELGHVERESEVNKRVSDVMAILTAPLERNALFERGTEGEMCEDGVKATCEGPAVCEDEGTAACSALCDSDDHEGQGHFYCKCKKGFTAKLCNVARKDAENKCTECVNNKGGSVCYPTSAAAKGYFCYDKEWHLLDVTKRGLDEREEPEGERLGRIARVLHTYINEAL